MNLSHLTAKSPALFQAALEILDSFSFKDLEEVTIQERFLAVAGIKNAILQRPDKKASSIEINILIRILGTVKFETALENALIKITQSAVNQLTQTTADIQQWLNLDNRSEVSRRDIYQRLHNAIIFQAGLEFKNISTLKDKFQPAKIYVGSDESKPTGWVEYNPATKRRDIYVNQHDHILSKGAMESVDIVTHETCHILADYFAFAYKENPNDIPTEIRGEFEALYWVRETNCVVPSSLYFGYIEQIEERIAFFIGEATSKYLESRLTPPSLTPPAP